MTDESAWLDNSNGASVRYDFYPPRHWTNERIAAEQAAIAALLEGVDGDADHATGPGWLRLAALLPGPLRHALVAELRAGNVLTAIGSTGWPSEGSVVASMQNRFTAARDTPPAGVAWRRPDDPHYAREELIATAGMTEHLVIA